MPKYLVLKTATPTLGENVVEFDEDSFNQKMNCLLTGKQMFFQDGNLILVYQIQETVEVIPTTVV